EGLVRDQLHGGAHRAVSKQDMDRVDLGDPCAEELGMPTVGLGEGEHAIRDPVAVALDLALAGAEVTAGGLELRGFAGLRYIALTYPDLFLFDLAECLGRSAGDRRRELDQRHLTGRPRGLEAVATDLDGCDVGTVLLAVPDTPRREVAQVEISVVLEPGV